MKFKLCNHVLLAFTISLAISPILNAQAEKEIEDPEYFAELDPITIKGKSVEDAGFAFVAKFRKKMIWAGIKALVVTKVGEDSPAARAGIEKGSRIIKIRDTDIYGLKIKELQDLLQEKAENGLIPLTIIPKDSDEARDVFLDFEFEKSQRQEKAEKKKR